MAKKFKKLEKLGIGRNKPTFIIAEAGINHNGDLKTALKMVEEAKKSGASAIKFQTYITEKRVKTDNSVYGILKQCELSHKEQEEIKKRADKVGIMFFSTPFDEESVDFLEDLEVALIKIASFDIVNHRLLDKVATTGIPIIISRGIANKKEIDAALDIFHRHKSDYALLHCVSAYPTPKEAVNLSAISTLLKHYESPVGFSDHTLDLEASLYAVAHGARILEKHFTLDKNMEGPDQKMSVEPKELRELSERVRVLEKMLGVGELKPHKVEMPTKIFRRPSKLK